MGVRYTGGPIVYLQTIRADTSANMRADLDAAVLAAGWTDKTAVTGGFKYTLTSPDGLQMKVWIQDLGDHTITNSFIRITPTSFDEVRVGNPQVMVYGGAFSASLYEVWANVCQFFVALVGTVSGATFINFACGIPAIPPDVASPCTAGLNPPTVTEAWWSSGAEGATDFRNSRYAVGGFSTCYNGSLEVFASGQSFDPGDGGYLALLPFCSTQNVDLQTSTPPQSVKYSNATPMRTDAFVGWDFVMRGQLWDAFLMATPAAAVDDTFSYTETAEDGSTLETSWVAWNRTVISNPNGGSGTWLGTLYLLTQAPFGESLANIAY
jgi:hypothetical protein